MVAARLLRLRRCPPPGGRESGHSLGGSERSEGPAIQEAEDSIICITYSSVEFLLINGGKVKFRVRVTDYRRARRRLLQAMHAKFSPITMPSRIDTSLASTTPTPIIDHPQRKIIRARPLRSKRKTKFIGQFKLVSRT